MIKKAVALLFLGILLQTGTVQAGNYSKCSNACSVAKCKIKSIAEQCAEWCEGTPALETVFNACKAQQPVAEHAGLDAIHNAEQVKQGNANPILPTAYDDVKVKAFCEAYAGKKNNLLADHGALEEKIANSIAGALGPGEIRIKRSRRNDGITNINEQGQPLKAIDTSSLHSLPNNVAGKSVKRAFPTRHDYYDPGPPVVRGGLIYGTAAAPAHLRNKGLCYFE